MRNPGGYATITHPDHPIKEADTFTCGHCNALRHVRAKQDPASIGGLCKVCMALICERCVDGRCDPFVEKIERWEARNEALRSYGTSSPF